ncbi:MAG: transglutaminase-like domain-containing protein [Thermomicrobiales bacterium]
MTEHAPYANQSPITDPGAMRDWLGALPADFRTLRALARPLVAHYRADDLEAFGIPPERLSEIDTRFAAAMLARLQEMDAAPLSPERAPATRLVGCCRDHTVLYLTLLREAGIPARARVGFASYFVPGWWLDHVVAEVWDAAEGRWRLIDAEISDIWLDRSDGAELDTLDLARDRFVVAGEAWQACRSGAADSERFVVAPDLDVPVTRGWHQLRHNLVQDLVALTRREMILWDTWGLLDDAPFPEAQWALLDGIAAVTANPAVTGEEASALYAATPGVQVPAEVRSMNVLSGEPRVVASGV